MPSSSSDSESANPPDESLGDDAARAARQPKGRASHAGVQEAERRGAWTSGFPHLSSTLPKNPAPSSRPSHDIAFLPVRRPFLSDTEFHAVLKSKPHESCFYDKLKHRSRSEKATRLCRRRIALARSSFIDWVKETPVGVSERLFYRDDGTDAGRENLAGLMERVEISVDAIPTTWDPGRRRYASVAPQLAFLRQLRGGEAVYHSHLGSESHYYTSHAYHTVKTLQAVAQRLCENPGSRADEADREIRQLLAEHKTAVEFANRPRFDLSGTSPEREHLSFLEMTKVLRPAGNSKGSNSHTISLTRADVASGVVRPNANGTRPASQVTDSRIPPDQRERLVAEYNEANASFLSISGQLAWRFMRLMLLPEELDALRLRHHLNGTPTGLHFSNPAHSTAQLNHSPLDSNPPAPTVTATPIERDGVLKDSIGIEFGTNHTDSHDDPLSYTVVLDLSHLPPGSHGGCFFDLRSGTFIEMDPENPSFYLFKGTNPHNGTSPTLPPTYDPPAPGRRYSRSVLVCYPFSVAGGENAPVVYDVDSLVSNESVLRAGAAGIPLLGDGVGWNTVGGDETAAALLTVQHARRSLEQHWQLARRLYVDQGASSNGLDEGLAAEHHKALTLAMDAVFGDFARNPAVGLSWQGEVVKFGALFGLSRELVETISSRGNPVADDGAPFLGSSGSRAARDERIRAMEEVRANMVDGLLACYSLSHTRSSFIRSRGWAKETVDIGQDTFESGKWQWRGGSKVLLPAPPSPFYHLLGFDSDAFALARPSSSTPETAFARRLEKYPAADRSTVKSEQDRYRKAALEELADDSERARENARWNAWDAAFATAMAPPLPWAPDVEPSSEELSLHDVLAFDAPLVTSLSLSFDSVYAKIPSALPSLQCLATELNRDKAQVLEWSGDPALRVRWSKEVEIEVGRRSAPLGRFPLVWADGERLALSRLTRRKLEITNEVELQSRALAATLGLAPTRGDGTGEPEPDQPDPCPSEATGQPDVPPGPLGGKGKKKKKASKKRPAGNAAGPPRSRKRPNLSEQDESDEEGAVSSAVRSTSIETPRDAADHLLTMFLCPEKIRLKSLDVVYPWSNQLSPFDPAPRDSTSDRLRAAYVRYDKLVTSATPRLVASTGFFAALSTYAWSSVPAIWEAAERRAQTVLDEVAKLNEESWSRLTSKVVIHLRKSGTEGPTEFCLDSGQTCYVRASGQAIRAFNSSQLHKIRLLLFDLALIDRLDFLVSDFVFDKAPDPTRGKDLAAGLACALGHIHRQLLVSSLLVTTFGSVGVFAHPLVQELVKEPRRGLGIQARNDDGPFASHFAKKWQAAIDLVLVDTRLDQARQVAADRLLAIGLVDDEPRVASSSPPTYPLLSKSAVVRPLFSAQAEADPEEDSDTDSEVDDSDDENYVPPVPPPRAQGLPPTQKEIRHRSAAQKREAKAARVAALSRDPLATLQWMDQVLCDHLLALGLVTLEDLGFSSSSPPSWFLDPARLKVMSHVGELPDKFLFLREAQPNRQASQGFDRTNHERLIVSTMIMRGCVNGSPSETYMLVPKDGFDGRGWYDFSMAAGTFADGSTGAIGNPLVYGAHTGVSVRHAADYLKEVPLVLAESTTFDQPPSWADTITWIRRSKVSKGSSPTVKSKVFTQVRGPLISALVASDLAYAGLAKFPTVPEMQTFVNKSKTLGAYSGLSQIGLVASYGDTAFTEFATRICSPWEMGGIRQVVVEKLALAGFAFDVPTLENLLCKTIRREWKTPRGGSFYKVQPRVLNFEAPYWQDVIARVVETDRA
ncbi:hypothetical protein JCM10212_004897 [Sporobolomyces blumeae]